jgi:hypothetical protein
MITPSLSTDGGTSRSACTSWPFDIFLRNLTTGEENRVDPDAGGRPSGHRPMERRSRTHSGNRTARRRSSLSRRAEERPTRCAAIAERSSNGHPTDAGSCMSRRPTP